MTRWRRKRTAFPQTSSFALKFQPCARKRGSIESATPGSTCANYSRVPRPGPRFGACHRPSYSFSLKELDEVEIQRLLLHLTEEQWTGILDLDLWSKDRVHLTRFLYRDVHMS